MNAELIKKNIQEHQDLWKKVFFALMINLVGVISKSTRGITLNFDGNVIKIIVIFETTPSEIEIDDLQNIEAELVSIHDYMSDLEIVVASSDQDISNFVKNWGWAYLRKEN